MRIIRTTDDLAEFSRALAERPFVAVDTEFMREKTYWPILCLVQAAAEGIEGIIDPLADGIDLSPFLDLMAHPSTVKVFHAARQDIEIFYNMSRRTPAPLFDTQIAAMACGFGEQIGYEPLMRTLVGASIDKGSRFTDWARRPLSEAQLSYALSDVTHLREAYPLLRKRLDEDGRARWVEQEMRALADPSIYEADPKDAWQRMKLRNVRPGDLGPIIALAEWREREAQEKNQPRGRILKDEAIYELARLKPKTPEELSAARSIPSGYERSRAAAGMLEAISKGRVLPRDELPKLESASRRAPASPDVVELLKVLLKRQSEKHGVAARLVASSADIEAIASGDRESPALTGWRGDMFGALALKLLDGQLALSLKNGSVELIEIDR